MITEKEIVSILKGFKREMDEYSNLEVGSGITEDDFDEVAEKVIKALITKATEGFEEFLKKEGMFGKWSIQGKSWLNGAKTAWAASRISMMRDFEREVHLKNVAKRIRELDEKNIVDLVARNGKMLGALKNLKGVFSFYHSHYKETKWDTCCSGQDCACMGRPTDPEYYIYQDLIKAEEVLKEIE